jgi:hypothetical protein
MESNPGCSSGWQEKNDLVTRWSFFTQVTKGDIGKNICLISLPKHRLH